MPKLLPVGLVLLLNVLLLGAQLKAAPLHLADYDAELRGIDGRVDIDAMIRRLKELGVTDYYWLVWHAATDWDDLQKFLPQAERAHIKVWVYLVPPTEGPPNGYPASEPFKLDYRRWGEEIARLSLTQRNLVGWVIDDFFANHQLFTPSYVGQLQSHAKAINPKLKFFPLMYFPELTSQFVEEYHPVIDGVVAAYPTDRDEIAQARGVLNGKHSVTPSQLSCPWHSPTAAGDFVSASIPMRVVSPERSRLRFAELDDFNGPTAGYHYKQVLVDGAVVWEQDVAGGTKGWQEVELNVTSQVAGKRNVTLTFRILDKRGVSNFGVRWSLKELHADGLKPAADLRHPDKWKVEQHGPWQAGFGHPAQPDRERFHTPFIVMTAAAPEEFRLRHGNPASPQRIADWVQMCLQARRDGLCDGVVTYCLDKRPQSQEFPLVANLFHHLPISPSPK